MRGFPGSPDGKNLEGKKGKGGRARIATQSPQIPGSSRQKVVRRGSAGLSKTRKILRASTYFRKDFPLVSSSSGFIRGE